MPEQSLAGWWRTWPTACATTASARSTCSPRRALTPAWAHSGSPCPTPAARSVVAPLPADADRGKVVLIPIGHTEQHGHHLPLNTDTVIIDAIARGTVDLAQGAAVTLPAYPGRREHASFCLCGHAQLRRPSFEDFWLAVLDVLAGRGFDRFT